MNKELLFIYLLDIYNVKCSDFFLLMILYLKLNLSFCISNKYSYRLVRYIR